MNKEVLVCCITGGIGSGKSAVCSVIESLCKGDLYYTDIEAKNIVNSSKVAKDAVVLLLGEEAYYEGRFNAKYVSQRVFADKTLLSALNNIIHPLVLEDINRWIEESAAKGRTLLFVESAIVIECGWKDMFDKLIVVTAPIDLRVKRVMLRDNISENEVLQRINNQMNEQQRLEYADYIIYCDEKHLMIPQIVDLYKKLKNDYEEQVPVV